jgi:hypothetical protein
MRPSRRKIKAHNMHKVLLVFFLLLSLVSNGQTGMWKPFKLIVIQPDTAVINTSLLNEKDSIVATQLKRYYQSVTALETFVNCINCPRDSGDTEKMKEELARLKSYENEAKNFKYFQLISSYSTEVFNFYFNEYEPYSTVIELPNQKTDIKSLQTLADTAKADYVIFYNNIHSVEKDGLPILKLTSSLYSKKNNRIILTKETEGDTNSRGDMWTCGSSNLSCLLINGVRTSTGEIAKILRRRQIRQK